MQYCFEDIVTISVISDSVNRINNKLALEEFIKKISLGQEAYIKVLELTFEGEPIFKTFIYQNNLYRVQIDGLNTSNPYKRRVIGTRLVEREEAYIKVLELTFEGEPIFKTFIYQNNLYRVQIDGLNTSNPYKRRVIGTRLVEREEADRVSYDLYYNNNFIETIFWYRKV